MSNNIAGLPLLLVGAGPMAVEYAKVLKEIGRSFVTVGRGKDSCDRFSETVKLPVVSGGIDTYLATATGVHDIAIVSVGVENLAAVTLSLLDSGIRRILVEKPAGLTEEDVADVGDRACELGADVYVGYNRRFYASTLRALEFIEEDGGVRSFIFEFTEWAHKVQPLKKADGVKDNWFYVNPTHVIDLAFFLGGRPSEITCYNRGALSWHPRGCRYAGAGVTDTEATFSYHADWGGAGRWRLEVITAKRRLIFCPLEQLRQIPTGSVMDMEVVLDEEQDKKYKPGLYRQTMDFLCGSRALLKNIQEQKRDMMFYRRMAGY